MRLFARKPAKKIVFLSRQSFYPSEDFKLLERALAGHLPDWRIDYACYADTAQERGGFSRRIIWTILQLARVASARLCIVDGYCPAVAIPRLASTTVVVQLWHALGAFKRFAWQTLDSTEGRSRQAAETLAMHRNYDLVIAGGPGAVQPFSEAFAIPPECILPIGLPRLDLLLAMRGLPSTASSATGRFASNLTDASQHPSNPLAAKCLAARAIVKSRYPQLNTNRLKVLYAPTFHRQNDTSVINSSTSQLIKALGDSCLLLISPHVLSQPPSSKPPKTLYQLAQTIQNAQFDHSASPTDSVVWCQEENNFALLAQVDVLVTDYSAIALEAAAIGTRTLFYVPDIATYRLDPGLNVDPQQLFPNLCFEDATALAKALKSIPQADDTLPTPDAFQSFARDYLVTPLAGATERIAQTICARLNVSFTPTPSTSEKMPTKRGEKT